MTSHLQPLGTWRLASGLIMEITRATIWVIGVINLLTKSPDLPGSIKISKASAVGGSRLLKSPSFKHHQALGMLFVLMITIITIIITVTMNSISGITIDIVIKIASKMS